MRNRRAFGSFVDSSMPYFKKLV